MAGTELPCTSNGSLIIPHAVQRAIGVNAVQERYRGETQVKEYKNFEAFYKQVKICFKETAEYALDLMNKSIDPICSYALTAPLYSVFFPSCIESGIDLYDGGAKYNNNSMCLIGFATAIDSIMAIKQLVFDEKKVTFDELMLLLKNNWQDKVVFHISDEPQQKHLENYTKAATLMKELLKGKYICTDALSHLDFYNNEVYFSFVNI